jgi:hypothetical protein
MCSDVLYTYPLLWLQNLPPAWFVSARKFEKDVLWQTDYTRLRQHRVTMDLIVPFAFSPIRKPAMRLFHQRQQTYSYSSFANKLAVRIAGSISFLDNSTISFLMLTVNGPAIL